MDMGLTYGAWDPDSGRGIGRPVGGAVETWAAQRANCCVSQTFAIGLAAVKMRPNSVPKIPPPHSLAFAAGLRRKNRLAAMPDATEPKSQVAG